MDYVQKLHNRHGTSKLWKIVWVDPFLLDLNQRHENFNPTPFHNI